MNGAELILIEKDRVRLAAVADSLKKSALAKASVIEEVNTPEDQKLAVGVQTELKLLLNDVEKARKTTKDPYLEMCRQIDDAARKFSGSLFSEWERVGRLVSQFQVREQERVQLELRRQAEEAARIEQEAAEAIARAEREAIEAAAKARAEEQAALRAAAAAKSEEQRKLMEAAAAAKAKEMTEIQAKLAAERQRQDELSAQQREAMGPAPTAARVDGQRVVTEWVIDSVDIWAVVKARPDLVNCTLKVAEAKAELARGATIKGIVAHETKVSTTRGKAALTLDV